MTNQDLKSHWDDRYTRLQDHELSWTESSKSLSYQWINEYSDQENNLIDIGAGRSGLLAELAKSGYKNLHHLELSSSASHSLQERLSPPIRQQIHWHIGNVLDFETETPMQFWHDRAVFHFFTDEADKARYFQSMERALSPEAYILMASFHRDGPEKCSGLNVARYDEESLFQTAQNHLKAPLQMVKATTHRHLTPSAQSQKFQYVLMHYSR